MSTRWQYFTTKGDIFIHSLAKSLVAKLPPKKHHVLHFIKYITTTIARCFAQ